MAAPQRAVRARERRAGPGHRARSRGAAELLERRGRAVASQRAGSLGGAVFRNVKPGAGYRVGRRERVARAAEPVGAAEHEAATARRSRASGYGYLTTRDGTKLAVNVRLPAGPGPYPTLVEYSGYGYANPDGARELDRRDRQPARLRGRRRQHARHRLLRRRVRLLRAAPGPRRLRRRRDRRAPAVGGAQQGRDGRASPTAASASCSSRATRPPSLAAITPLSVIDNTATTLYPGGILNTGFALNWAKDRVHDAQAGARDRRPGVGAEADPGRRQDLQGQPGAAPRGGRPAREDPRATASTCRRSPTRSRRSRSCTRSSVPVFLACQWTDEQTGGHCPTLASRFTGTDRSGSRSPTAPTSTRSTRRRSTAGSTSSSSTSRRRAPQLSPGVRGGSRR